MQKKSIIAALVLTLGIMLFQGNAHSQPGSEIQVLQEIVKEQIHEIDKWQSNANLLLLLTIIVGVLGVVTGVLQKFDKNWCKGAVIAAGAIISLITVVNNTVFESDHRTLRAKATKARHLIQDIRILMVQDINQNSEEDRQAWLGEIRDKLSQISDLTSEIYAANLKISLVTTAYAQSRQDPEWIEKLPVDKINFYFLGVGESASLEKAKELSHQNAIDEAAKYLTSEFNRRQREEPVSININKLTAFLTSSAKVKDNYWHYDPSDSLYSYFILLSLNRKFAQTDIKLFAVQERIEFPKALSNALESAKGPSQENLSRLTKDYKSVLLASKDSLSSEQYGKFVKAQRLRKSGEHEEAVQLLNEILKNNPSYYLGWYDLALAYDDGLKDFEKANHAYKKAIELEPVQPARHPSLYNNYGYFLLKNKKYEEAAKYLKIAVELDPDHPYAEKNLKAAEAALK